MSLTTLIAHKIPARHANLVMPFLLSLFMSGLISGISTLRVVGFHSGLFSLWPVNWMISWMIAFPTVLLVLPVVRKITVFLIEEAK
jgi:hypothetical protein